jgi:hypothetical protein
MKFIPVEKFFFSTVDVSITHHIKISWIPGVSVIKLFSFITDDEA